MRIVTLRKNVEWVARFFSYTKPVYLLQQGTYDILDVPLSQVDKFDSPDLIGDHHFSTVYLGKRYKYNDFRHLSYDGTICASSRNILINPGMTVEMYAEDDWGYNWIAYYSGPTANGRTTCVQMYVYDRKDKNLSPDIRYIVGMVANWNQAAIEQVYPNITLQANSSTDWFSGIPLPPFNRDDVGAWMRSVVSDLFGFFGTPEGYTKLHSRSITTWDYMRIQPTLGQQEVLSLLGSLMDLDRVQDDLYSTAGLPLDERHVPWADLSAKALSTLEMDFSGNGLMYTNDVREFGNYALSLGKLVKKAKVGKKLLATIASGYLALHYGLRLFIQDTKDLYNAMSDPNLVPLRRLGATENYRVKDYNVERRYNVYYDPHSSIRSELENLLINFDLYADMGNIWDSIPLSFVADWFISIGDSLAAIDSYRTVTQKFRVHMTTKTTKATFAVRNLPKGLSGSLTGELYLRYCDPVIETPSLYVTSSTQNPLRRHGVEAGALLLSNR